MNEDISDTFECESTYNPVIRDIVFVEKGYRLVYRILNYVVSFILIVVTIITMIYFEGIAVERKANISAEEIALDYLNEFIEPRSIIYMIILKIYGFINSVWVKFIMKKMNF